MEDVHFLHRQANWCYQLAWQCFDLTVAHRLNVMGNELTAKARKLQSPQCKEHPAKPPRLYAADAHA
jgi:hypothetical protein